jgi:hypothetical protein
MTTLQLIEVAVAAALILGGAWLYIRRGRQDGSRGSQSAVILIFIGLILAIHGLGLMEYRPSEGEIARAQLVGN